MEHQLVVFDLANEHYGVDISAVDSIIKMQPITAMPHTPSFVEGITTLRGAVLPVVDLRRRFGLPADETTKETRIVVVEMDGSQVGMVVDGVSEVLQVQEESIEPPSPVVVTVDGDWSSRNAFITGIAKVNGQDSESKGGRLIILLDLDKVLSPEEQASLPRDLTGETPEV